ELLFGVAALAGLITVRFYFLPGKPKSLQILWLERRQSPDSKSLIATDPALDHKPNPNKAR
ncbi:MAG TPA: hypothetical protein VJ124_10790, partial [Pyrinomonadaceae bacterium]|nr:hypothetical protein [Pyrinomonadaceae bacterium]